MALLPDSSRYRQFCGIQGDATNAISILYRKKTSGSDGLTKAQALRSEPGEPRHELPVTICFCHRLLSARIEAAHPRRIVKLSAKTLTNSV